MTLFTHINTWRKAGQVLAGLAFALACATVPQAKAQQVDTLRLMHYNLCNYGNPVFSCTRTNRVGMKDSSLRVILAEVLPDMLDCNEINSNPVYSDRILNQVLNAGPNTDWARAATTNVNGTSDLVNGFFYRTSKVGLKAQYVAQTYVRDINHYRMFVQPQPGQTDTTFFNVVVTHLKAGNTAPDRVDRANMVRNLNTYLATQDTAEGFFFEGDFNFYKASESANQMLVVPDSGGFFVDPLNRQGNWSNNGSFADVHTQSPHGEATADGCHSNGGIDDRFDFQLCTRGLLDNTRKLSYLPSAFRVIGNDGHHFNLDVTAQPNNSVSPAVAAALRHSDHLPIMGKLLVQVITSVQSKAQSPDAKAWLGGNSLYVKGVQGPATAVLYAVTGAELARLEITGDGTPVALPAGLPQSGTVVLRVMPHTATAAPASFRLNLSTTIR